MKTRFKLYIQVLLMSTAMFGSVCLTAQGHFYNEGTFQVAASASAEITGDVTLEKPVLGDGRVVMQGVNPQTIGGTQVSINNLILANNAQVSLLNTAHINDTLHLLAGKLFLEDEDLLLGDQSISSGNASAFVVTSGTGVIQRLMDTTAFTFHTGFNNEYFPLTLSEAGTPDTFAVQAWNYLPDDGLVGGTPLTSHIALCSWSFTDHQPGGNDITMVQQWYDSKNAGDFVQQYATGIYYDTAYSEILPCPVNVSTVNPNVLTYQHLHFTGIVGVGDSVYASHIPLAAVVPGDTSICDNTSIYFTAQPSGAAYMWSTTENTQTIHTSVAGNYWVQITDSTGCTYKSNEVTLGLLASPAVPVINQAGNVLSVNPVYTGYQWYNGATAIVGANSNTYTVTGNGSYSIIVTNANNCEATASYNFNTFGMDAETLEHIWITGSHQQIYIGGLPSSPVAVTVMDIQGKVVYTSPVAQPVIPLQVSAGIYLVKLHNDWGIQVFKLYL